MIIYIFPTNVSKYFNIPYNIQIKLQIIFSSSQIKLEHKKAGIDTLYQSMPAYKIPIQPILYFCLI